MKKSRLLPAFLLLTIAFTVNAQKLPNVQQTGFRSPDSIKIDGNLNEWGNKFMAYNSANKLFYSISNDNDNLYLVAEANDFYTIEKLLFGGITLTIEMPNDKGSKKVKVSSTFPVLGDNFPKVNDIFFSVSIASNNYLNDTAKTAKKKLDSLISMQNKKMQALFKEIGLAGIKEIQDTLISVYNSDGIKAAMQFDGRLRCTYELAVPLKYLNADLKNDTKFKYNIKLIGKPGYQLIKGRNVPFPIINGSDGQPDPNELFLYNPTDFSGEYTLAKK